MGTLAGRYQVGALIGRGGMADVYVGQDARLGRRVAIKLLKPALATDPAFRSRFRREAQDAAKMAHPTIVRIFDAGEETTTDPATGAEMQVPFIIMEFVDGRLLSELIAEGPLEPKRAADIAEQVLTALEYSHRAGLVHRDIKPGNIMITASGQVKVMDFGIARAISETSSTIAEASMIVGTAQYFSPEQARGEAVDARTDLYSAGVVLFEMLTGRAPFVGDNPVAVAYQHVNQQAARPSQLNPRVSPALDAVVMRAITKDRFERYQTASDFREDLEAASAGIVATKRPERPADFTTTLFGVNPSATKSSEATMRQLQTDDRTRGSRSSQSRPPVAWIWGGVVVTIAIVVAVVYFTLNLSAITLPNTISVTVPDVTGQSIDDASAQLTAHKLKVYENPQSSNAVKEGTVIRTDPGEGITVSPGTTIRVYVSTGAQQLNVPLVTTMTLDEATKALEAVGLKVDSKTTTSHSPDVPNKRVMETTPAGGSEARRGDTVSLVLSDGRVDIPDERGKVIGDALALLQGEDYQLDVDVRADSSCTGNKVVSQSVSGIQRQHVAVTLTYCAGNVASNPPTNDPGTGDG
jgi:serine/threonine-protein kinase